MLGSYRRCGWGISSSGIWCRITERTGICWHFNGTHRLTRPLKMKAVCSPEMMGKNWSVIWHHTPQQQNPTLNEVGFCCCGVWHVFSKHSAIHTIKLISKLYSLHIVCHNSGMLQSILIIFSELLNSNKVYTKTWIIKYIKMCAYNVWRYYKIRLYQYQYKMQRLEFYRLLQRFWFWHKIILY